MSKDSVAEAYAKISKKKIEITEDLLEYLVSARDLKTKESSNPLDDIMFSVFND